MAIHMMNAAPAEKGWLLACLWLWWNVLAVVVVVDLWSVALRDENTAESNTALA